MRLEIRVQPGASRRVVGGTHDGALVVRVTEPAEGGRATSAALEAVADALGLSARSVSLVRGTTSRRKVIDVEVAPDQLDSVEEVLGQLRTTAPPARGGRRDRRR